MKDRKKERMKSRPIFWQSLQMAADSVKNNFLRSFLTILGIVIGVSSVIGMITITNSVTDNVMTQFDALGAGTLTLTTQKTALVPGLSETILNDIRSIDGVQAISPSASLMTTAEYKGELQKNVTVMGYDIPYFLHNPDLVKEGRAFRASETSGSCQICLVDEAFIQKALSGNGGIGTEFILNGYTYRIIGILDEEQSLSGGMQSYAENGGTVAVPYKNVLNMTLIVSVSSVSVYVKDGYSLNDVEEPLNRLMQTVYGKESDAYSILNLSALRDMMSSVYDMMGVLAGAIASISLIVGGIGIMNMMLFSVSDRTREIGLRNALGARPGGIQLQFLLEAMMMSLAGGGIGIALGILFAFAGASLMGVPFHVSAGTILLGSGFSVAIGIVFGWAPAKKASELNPIDALRAE